MSKPFADLLLKFMIAVVILLGLILWELTRLRGEYRKVNRLNVPEEYFGDVVKRRKE